MGFEGGYRVTFSQGEFRFLTGNKKKETILLF